MGNLSDTIVPFFENHTLPFFGFFAIWYLMVHSDVMVDLVLSQIDGATVGYQSTTKGTLIQLALMIIGYLLIMFMLSIVL